VASTFLLYSARTYTLHRLWSITDRIVSSRFSFAVESREREVPSAEVGPREGKGRGVPTGKSRRIVEGLFRMKYVFSLQMTEQARESEHTRRKLERARQEVFHHMTRIKSEKESLEREVTNGRRGSN
jgi:hypothetical protein